MAKEQKKFKKQILRFGKWKHDNAPDGVLEITRNYGEKLVNNFAKSPFAPVLRGHVSDDEANKNPYLIVNKNISGISLENDGVYAELAIDEKELDKYADVSASIDPNYKDHETGEELGPTLRHIALVTNPFIKGLKPFIALSEKTDKDYLIFLSDIDMANENETETKTEAVVEETAEAVEETAEVVEETKVEEETEKVATEEPDEVETEAEETPAEVETEAPAVDTSEIDQLKVELAELKAEKAKLESEAFYQGYLKAGKVTPAMKDSVVSLAATTTQVINLADNSTKTVKELLVELLNKMPALVNLEEKGINLEDGKPLDLTEKEVAHQREIYLKDHPKATETDFAEYYERIVKPVLAKK